MICSNREAYVSPCSLQCALHFARHLLHVRHAFFTAFTGSTTTAHTDSIVLVKYIATLIQTSANHDKQNKATKYAIIQLQLRVFLYFNLSFFVFWWAMPQVVATLLLTNIMLEELHRQHRPFWYCQNVQTNPNFCPVLCLGLWQ